MSAHGRWAEGTPLRALDVALADQLQTLAPALVAEARWLAALCSHQWARGHACLDLAALRDDAPGLLGWSAEQAARLPAELSRQPLSALAGLSWLDGDGSPLVLSDTGPQARLYLRRAWQAEQTVLSLLGRRLAETPRDCPGLAGHLAQLAPGQGPVPDWQQVACALAARGRFTLIVGGPGTGKTTTVARLLALRRRQAQTECRELRVLLAAPTGKAAMRLNHAIQGAAARLPEADRLAVPSQAQTLHRLLKMRPHRVESPAPLETDLLVVDEASMIDLEMMARLLQALPPQADLVLLGDQDQLASVDAGAVLSQLAQDAQRAAYSPATRDWLRRTAGLTLNDDAGPGEGAGALAQQTVQLRHSHRFSVESGIGRWAEAVRRGDADQVGGLLAALPWTDETPLRDVARLRHGAGLGPRFEALLRAGWADWLRDLRALGDGPASDGQALTLLEALGRFQILCGPVQGRWGVQALNQQAAQALGLPAHGWAVGRPVMATHNDPHLGVMNGDVGLCLPRPEGLRVAFAAEGGAVRWVLPSRLEGAETAFAMTVHKAQGSEFDRVLVVLPDRASPLLSREWLYTALTRARTGLCWLVPTDAVLAQSAATRVQRGGGLAGRL